MRKIAVVPAFNEEKAVEAVLRAIRAEAPDFDVLVVDDGSSDRTAEVAGRVPGVRVVRLAGNIGIGGAVQTGFLYAARRGYDLAVQVDADGQHKPSEIGKIARPVLAGEADAAIGSRFLGGAAFKSTPPRRAGIGIFRLINRLVLRERVTDSTSGFRAYGRAAIELLSRTYPDDYPEPEAVFILKRAGLRVAEVPVEMAARAAGRSSISLAESLFYMVKVCLAIFVLLLRRER